VPPELRHQLGQDITVTHADAKIGKTITMLLSPTRRRFTGRAAATARPWFSLGCGDMTPRARIAIVAVAVVALIVAFIAASGTSDKKSPTSDTVPRVSTVGTTVETTPAGSTTTETTTTAAPAIPVVRVVGAKPQGGVKRLQFSKGDTIRFRVQSDTADEVHVHGYDVHKDVAKGGSVTFTIPAKIEGRFVVELEGSGTQIAELEVQP
jgi:hypothetical protein